MKKKIFAILISLITIVAVVGFNHIDKQDVIINNGVKYAIKLNGEKTNNFPAPGKYNVIVNCNNANAKWDYDAWNLRVYNINEGAACDINFTSMDNYPQLNDKIISLKGNGQVFEENGIRYEGKSPDNYIWFNNELWRIIGVFDTNIPDVGNKQLVKIIKNESIGGLVWDKSGSNNWSTSSLKELLNGAYLQVQNGTGTDYCYGYSTNVPANCDYREIGIKDGYREMIENVTWYLGGPNETTYPVNQFYNDERNPENIYNGNATSWDGKIGLMYASDYGYSVMSNTCPRSTNLNKYNNKNCGDQNWLYGKGFEWTITSSRYGAFSVSTDGNMTDRTVEDGYAVLPVLYLKSNVYTKGGDGSLDNPYVIGI